MALLIVGGLDYMIFKGPFQPKLFSDSIFRIALVFGWLGMRKRRILESPFLTSRAKPISK